MDLLPGYKIYAILIAESINLRQYRNDYGEGLLSGSLTDLFYREQGGRYMYLLDYGVVAFAGYSSKEMQTHLDHIRKYCEGTLAIDYREDFVLEGGSSQLEIGNSSLRVTEITPDVVKITMLNVCQSATIDFFTESAQNLLDDSRQYTRILEKHGRFRMSKTRLLKFMGRALNLRNRIIDNLYILDTPDTVWENEYLERLHLGLNRTFDLKNRFNELDYTLKIVENNLSTFASLVQSKESMILELIIIFLILFEILYAFAGKFLF
jgi:required for meiotic nuclear division protein 1